MAKISFKRSGGMLGREIEADIDLNELPAGESQALMQLISETDFFRVPQNLIDHSTPDEYEYTVTVDAGNTHHTVQVTDATMPESLRPLLDKLTMLARENDSSTA